MSEVGRVSENDCTPFLQNGSAGKSRNYLSAPQATTVPTITRYFQLGEPPEKLGVQDKGWLNNNMILSGTTHWFRHHIHFAPQSFSAFLRHHLASLCHAHAILRLASQATYCYDWRWLEWSPMYGPVTWTGGAQCKGIWTIWSVGWHLAPRITLP